MVRAPKNTARPVMRGPWWYRGAWGVDVSGVSGCVDNLALASAKIGNLWNEALAGRKISAMLAICKWGSQYPVARGRDPRLPNVYMDVLGGMGSNKIGRSVAIAAVRFAVDIALCFHISYLSSAVSLP